MEIYADAVSDVLLTGPVVRLDLVSFSVTEKDDKNQPKPEFRQRIVMPVDGFVRSFALMAQAMQQLEKQGVVRRQGAEGKETTDATTAAAAAPTSKNFR